MIMIHMKHITKSAPNQPMQYVNLKLGEKLLPSIPSLQVMPMNSEAYTTNRLRHMLGRSKRYRNNILISQLNISNYYIFCVCVFTYTLHIPVSQWWGSIDCGWRRLFKFLRCTFQVAVYRNALLPTSRMRHFYLDIKL